MQVAGAYVFIGRASLSECTCTVGGQAWEALGLVHVRVQTFLCDDNCIECCLSDIGN